MAHRKSVAADNFCGICKSAYTSPRLLDCFHVYCTPCLENLIENKKIVRCPLCRIDLPPPKEGIEKFPLCPFMEIRNDENTSEITCQMCDETEVHSRCVDCDQNMCRSCHDYHLRNKTFRKHILIEEVNTELAPEQNKSLQEDIECDKHKKEHSFYCKSCNVPICEECKKSKQHFFHKTEHLDGTVQQMISSLTSLTTSLNSKLPFMDNTIENAKTEQTKYQTHTENTKIEFQRAASNLKEWMCTSVDMVLSDCLQSFESFSRTDKKTFQTYIEEAELRRIDMIKFKKTVEGIINCGIQSKIVKLSSAVCTQSKRYDENNSLSERMLNFPKLKPGSLSYKYVKDFFGLVETEENKKVLPTVNFPCLQTIDYVRLNTFAKELQFRSEPDVTDLMATSGSCVCATQVTFSKCDYKRVGKVIAYDLSGKSKVNSTEFVLGGRKHEFIGVNNGKCFLWFGPSIRTIQVKNEGGLTSTKFLLWENDIPNLSEQGCACIVENRNILILINNKFYEVNETGKTVRIFSCSDILECSGFQANCILYTQTKSILIARSNEILAISLIGDLKYVHKFEGGNIVSMCGDRHGNVFVADSNRNRICLMSSDGHFVRDVSTSKDGIYSPMSVTIDGRGNLWVLQNNNTLTVTVYSYL